MLKKELQPKPRLNAFSGIKVLAVAGIIACHAGLFPGWDLCARMVEVLFLVSGFCMAYNYYEKTTEPTLAAGVEIVKGKLPRLYSIHLATFLLQLFFVATWAQKPLEYIFSVGLLNLSLQHAWFPATQFTFNNVSWFLSALIFCYFITPTLTGAARTANARHRLGALFLLIAAIRFYLEYMERNHPALIPLDLHANPLIQSLNYSLGFIAGVWFINASNANAILNKRLSAAAISWLEFLFVALYLAACYTLADTAYRLFFILLALPPLYLLAFNRGVLSRTLAAQPLRWLETITLEVFMFHSFILYHYPVNRLDPWYDVKFAAITLAAAAVWHFAYIAVRRHFFR